MDVGSGLRVACLLLVLIAAAATATAGAPSHLRAGDTVPGSKEGVFLLHAGNERPTTVRVYATGPPGSQPMETDHVFRSKPEWTRHTYALEDEAYGAEIRTDGPVWMASGGRYLEDRRVVLDCDALGDFVYWNVRTEEVRVQRDDWHAPQLRFFTPVAGPLVPDEPAIRDHTMLLGQGESPLYFEVIEGPDGCSGTVTLQAGLEPGASPFAVDLLVFLRALGLLGGVLALILIAVWILGRARDRRRRRPNASLSGSLLYAGVFREPQMWRPLALLLVLVGAVFLLPHVAASDWGVHEVQGGATVTVPGEALDHWVCVWAERPDGGVVLHQGSGAGEPTPRAFTPTERVPDCRMLPGEDLRVDEAQEGLVRVLVLAKPPQSATSPGVVRLASPGVALALDRVTAETEVGILPDGDGVRVAVVRADDLGVVTVVSGPGENRFVLGSDSAPDAGVWFVLVDAPGRASALVDWEDPNWFATAPTIGHIAVVVAVAFFLILYPGRSVRRLG